VETLFRFNADKELQLLMFMLVTVLNAVSASVVIELQPVAVIVVAVANKVRFRVVIPEQSLTSNAPDIDVSFGIDMDVTLALVMQLK